MTKEEAKTLIHAFYEVNKRVRDAFRDPNDVVKYTQTDKYWQAIADRYNYLKNTDSKKVVLWPK